MTDATTDTTTHPHRAELTVTELALVRDATTWVDRDPDWADRVVDGIGGAARRLLDRALRSSSVQSAVHQGAATLVQRFEVPDVQPPPAVRALGGSPTSDARRRDDALAQAEADAAAVARRHAATLGVQGALAGAAGTGVVTAVAALATDVAASTVGLLRAAAATLVAYGHTDDLLGTSLAAVLLAGERDAAARRDGLVRAARRGRTATAGTGGLPAAVAEQAALRSLNQTVETVVRRRLQQRALVAVPLLGAAAGGATSAFTTTRTCEAARHVGRLHLVARATGRDAGEVLSG